MSGSAGRIALAIVLLGGCVLPEDDRAAHRVQRLGAQCGEERWQIKTGADRDASSVNLSPQDTQISELVGWPRPAYLPQQRRIVPYERQTYRLTRVTLLKYKRESDGDYHLVLSDGSNTMIAEIPSPDCVGTSPFTDAIRRTRDRFESRYTPEERFQYSRLAISISGVGFFDYFHDQAGVAANAIELHPVLDICFGSNCRLTAPEQGPNADTVTSAPTPLGCNCGELGGPDFALALLVLVWARRVRAGRPIPGRRTAE